jgi:hypothetical protein
MQAESLRSCLAEALGEKSTTCRIEIGRAGSEEKQWQARLRFPV